MSAVMDVDRENIAWEPCLANRHGCEHALFEGWVLHNFIHFVCLTHPEIVDIKPIAAHYYAAKGGHDCPVFGNQECLWLPGSVKTAEAIREFISRIYRDTSAGAFARGTVRVRP